MSEIKRLLSLTFSPNPLKKSSVCFLWGPRQVGKTTFLHQNFNDAKFYNLLDNTLRTELMLNPSRIKEEINAGNFQTIVIDEIQRVPALLDEVQDLVEKKPINVILCGSSARKLKKEANNLLGGRALRYELFPFVYSEIRHHNPSLQDILSKGLIPSHFLVQDARGFLNSYVADYLNEEISKESLVRNLPSFARFLHVLALTHGQLLNYSKIASEVGISSKTVKEYYQILKDTLLGFELIPWNKRKDRRLIETSKFYLFDVGIANFLRKVYPVQPSTDLFGFAFEHYLIAEIRAYLSYFKKYFIDLYFYRSASGIEVDLIIGDMILAIEFKATKKITNNELKSLRNLKKEFKVKRSILVSLNDVYRKTEDNIEMMNWKFFLDLLWSNSLID